MIEQSKPIKEAVAFNQLCEKFRQENKYPPGTFAHRYSQYYSVDHYFNERLVRACGLNIEKSRLLQELTLFGFNLSAESCKALADSLIQSTGRSLNKLELKFCQLKQPHLRSLLPCFLQPDEVPLTELSLAGNEITCEEGGYILSKILI